MPLINERYIELSRERRRLFEALIGAIFDDDYLGIHTISTAIMVIDAELEAA